MKFFKFLRTLKILLLARNVPDIQRRNFEKKRYEVSINCHIWLRVVLGQSFRCPSDQQKWSHVDDLTNSRLVTFWEVRLPFIASLSYKASISVQWWELLDLPHIHVIDNACRLARMIQLCIVCRSPHILYPVSGYRIITR